MQTLTPQALLLTAVVALLPSLARAELLKVKGKGEMTYQGAGTLADYEAAIVQAKKNALLHHLTSLPKARYELYRRLEQQLLTNINQYVPEFTRLDAETNSHLKSITVLIEASIDGSLLEHDLQAFKPISNTNFMTFVFVARELASRTSFVPKVTTARIYEVSKSGTEKVAVLREEGGNTVIKTDKLVYRCMTVGEVDSAVNSVLALAHYQTVTPEDAGLDVGAFEKDFSCGNDISPSTRNAAVKTCLKKGIRFLAQANMEVGQPEPDPATGLTRVYVSVSAKVSDLSQRLPTTVASVPARPYAALGQNPEVATLNALNEAARNSAADLVDKLRLEEK